MKKSLKSQKITVDGNVFEVKFDDMTFDYQVLTCSDETTTTKETYSHGESIIETEHFINDNTYWVSPEGKK